MPLTLRLAGGVRTGAGAVKRGGEVGNGRVRNILKNPQKHPQIEQVQYDSAE